MSHFHVLYLSSRNIWFHALNQEFTNLAKTNSCWSYSLRSSEFTVSTEPQLQIIDFTGINNTALVSALPLDGPRLLVLVRMSHKHLIRELLFGHRCSLLCVDEHLFSVRDLVECCCRQKRFLSPLIRSLNFEQPDVHVSLTKTENSILSLLREGKKGVDISKELNRSQKTISTHKRSIMRKLGVRSDLALKRKLQTLYEIV